VVEPLVHRLGALAGWEAHRNKVVESAVSGLHPEQRFKKGTEAFPRIVHGQGAFGSLDELLQLRFEGAHQ
jgi:hypothetical protein